MNNRAELRDIFELQKDKDLRDHNALQSFELVSLWEVLKVKAEDFVEIFSILAMTHGYLRALANQVPPKKSVPKPKFLDDCAKKLCRISNRMGLKVLADRAEELRTYLQENASIDIALLDRMMTPLQNKVIRELKSELFLRVRPGHSQYYNGKKAFLSRRTLKDLPEIKNEEKKARRCFAFEKYTASAFHLMRIMELLVQRFGKKLSVTFDSGETPWGNILESCRQEMDKWDKKHPNHAHKKQYIACYNLMDGLRPARNDLMHYRQNYDEDSVNDLKGTVELAIKAFVKLPNLTVAP